MLNKLLIYNLQLFAEEEGANEVADTAESAEVETTESDESETTESNEGSGEPEKQSDEDNARYANIRRKAEEDARRRYEAEISKRDAEFANLCKGINHPTTGKPITTEAEYVDALRQQKRMEREAEFKEKGIDPQLIDQIIEESPLFAQAREVIERDQLERKNKALQSDLEQIMALDPSIKSFEDLANLPNFNGIVDKMQNRNWTLLEAYKNENFDALVRGQKSAAHQQAINDMRGKSHLATTQGITSDDDNTVVDIPQGMLSRWRDEGKSDKEIRSLYKRTMEALHIK